MGSQDDVMGRVAGAGYRVDAGAVAEAMLRRPGVAVLLGATGAVRPDGGARSPAAPAPRPQAR